jgi:hypothetical protein
MSCGHALIIDGLTLQARNEAKADQPWMGINCGSSSLRRQESIQLTQDGPCPDGQTDK